MYQILVRTKNKQEYSEFDIEKTEKEILTEYIIPYLSNRDFFLGTCFVNKKDITDIIVKQTTLKIDVIHTCLQKEFDEILFYFNTKENTLKEDYSGKNIVSNLINLSKKSYLIKNQSNINANKNNSKTTLKSNEIFIVHGHDNEMKINVARFIEQLGLMPIILHEQASKGQTLLEKIDEYTNVRHGIILYSPCDTGKSNKEENYKNRARQNVVFEHGYLIGKLGKNKVTALTKGNIETPSDIGEIIYVPYDNNEGWKIKIGTELKANGFKIDFNKII